MQGSIFSSFLPKQSVLLQAEGHRRLCSSVVWHVRFWDKVIQGTYTKSKLLSSLND